MVPLTLSEEEEFARLMEFDGEDEPPALDDQTCLSPPNLIQSYTALLILGILSDDFSRLDRAGLLRFVARCQLPDGSYVSSFPFGQVCC